MKKNPNPLWIVAIVLGWLFDFLFWKTPGGINFAIFTWLCLAGGFFLLWRDEKPASRGSLWLIPLILFFDAVTFIRAEPLTVFLAAAFTLFLMAALAMTYLGGRWFKYSLSDYVSGFFKLIASMIARPLTFNAEVKCEQAESGATAPKRNLWPVARGIIIALPVLAIFAALLASADAIFSQQLDTFIKFFKLENLPEYIFRFIYILVGAYLLAGVFLHAATQSQDEKLIGEDKPVIAPFLGFTETSIVFGGVIILFTLFVIIQFRYFFGGQVNLGVGGLTDSEYARRGFGELAAVAVLSLFMILGSSTITVRENANQKRIYSGLSVTIVGLVVVILISAYQRLVLNELAHGFFRLRTYSHVFYIWLALLLVAVVVLEILRRERYFAIAIIIASLGFAASLSLLNVDAFIVRHNIQRAVDGKYLNVPDMASLSDDSVPPLVDEFLSSSLPASIHEAVGAILLCRSQYNSVQQTDDWRSFTFSRWMSNTAITKIQADLDQYKMNRDKWPVKVHSPSNAIFECE